MEAEKLKVIAEGMGYQTRIADAEPFEGQILIYKKCMAELYNPDTTNAEQCMEIMEKLRVSVRPILDFWVADPLGGLTSQGKTINEAICNAAFEYFKEANGEQ